MQLISLLPVLSLLFPVFLSAMTLVRAAPSDVSKRSAVSDDVSEAEGQYEDGVSDTSELEKRLSNFVRIGRPNSFVRIGRGSHFVRIGRPGNFVRIGRGGFEGSDLDDLPYDSSEDMEGLEKRPSHFVRIGKGSRFVRIGKSGVAQLQTLDPETSKRVSSFVRIGKADPLALLGAGAGAAGAGGSDSDDHNAKRASSFVRIGRIPSSAFVRIGRNSGEEDGEAGDFGTFDRIARMGQSSFVRIGKREADPVKLAAVASAGSARDAGGAENKEDESSKH